MGEVTTPGWLAGSVFASVTTEAATAAAGAAPIAGIGRRTGRGAAIASPAPAGGPRECAGRSWLSSISVRLVSSRMIASWRISS